MSEPAARNAGALLGLLDAIVEKLSIVSGFELPTAILLLDLAERSNGSLICFEANLPQPGGLSQATIRRLIQVLDAKGLLHLRRLGPDVIRLSLAKPGEMLVAELAALQK